jgi:pimeloyl-ACP methyl ester carboxylesterase
VNGGADYSGEWYLPVDDGPGRLYVLEQGRGPFVLAVHGGPGHDHGYVRDGLKPLEHSHRVVYFDQRGSLRSPMPIDRISLDGVIGDFRLLVDELGAGPTQVVAHSMGCVSVAAALERFPDLFAEIVLVSPGPLRAAHPWPPPQDVRPEVTAELARRSLDREKLSPKEKTWAWRIQFAGTNLYHVDRWADMGGGQVFYNPRVGDAIRSGLPDGYDYVPALQAHRCRVTLVVGDHDFVDPGAVQARGFAAGALRTVVVAEAGHALWIDQPARFADILAEALPASP